ncbi:glycosyltransferase family 8 protein [Nakamurella flavida]|uniref:Glycosyltransferase family 8 protein n=1 Tax=Nakamurella flavida TaxID=363630 RepID=A0A938YPT4_9ACTN|nr:glycosyltransferase family 8 protein [Nakamurella flavida]MBM9478481.1 glycosyltransferase family 8 protein [Nakamurella flavida]MDP9777693.1 alpha-N-acetylglucosamine transferase [Nakamurella flavida]
MNAWVTLLTQPNYLDGARTLRASIAASGSPHPFVVMVTDGIGPDDRRLLEADGCLVREVRPLRPADDGVDGYANARFAEVWTKLAVWGLTEFERVVFLDADMLVTRSMDELFDLELPDGGIAACHACRCNPNRIASYPADWTPANCFYSYCRGPEHTSEPGVVGNYLNGGFLVLTPDAAVLDDMSARLAGLADLSGFPFAEQDFLNEYYQDRWLPQPYVYNALKTLPFQHPTMWDAAEVKNIHFIIDKPWEQQLSPDDRYFALHELWWDAARAAGTAPVVAGH